MAIISKNEIKIIFIVISRTLDSLCLQHKLLKFQNKLRFHGNNLMRQNKIEKGILRVCHSRAHELLSLYKKFIILDSIRLLYMVSLSTYIRIYNITCGNFTVILLL